MLRINKYLFFLFNVMFCSAYSQSIALVKTRSIPNSEDLKGTNFLHIRDNEGETFLIRAARQNDIYDVKLAANNGANVEAKDYMGHNALYYALKNNNVELLKVLIEAGVDINKEIDIKSKPYITYINFSSHKDPKTALEYAIKNSFLKGIEILLKNNVSLEAFGLKLNLESSNFIKDLLIFSDNHLEMAQLILRHIIVSSVPDNLKNQFLLHACSFDLKDCVELLLKQEADVNSKDENGDTPFLEACRNSSCDVIDILLKHGAEFNTKNNDGKSPLYFACENSKDVVSKLMQMKLDVNCKDKLGNTPLMNAVMENKSDIVKYLLINKDVLVNEQNLDGKTALMLAFEKKFDLITQILVNSNADSSIKDNQGNSVNVNLNVLDKDVKNAYTCIDSESIKNDLVKAGINLTLPQKLSVYRNRIIASLLGTAALGGILYYIKNKYDSLKKNDSSSKQTRSAKPNGNKDMDNLIQAIKSGTVETVNKLLTSIDIDLNVKDEFGKSALDYAKEFKNQEMINMLLKYGAV